MTNQLNTVEFQNAYAKLETNLVWGRFVAAPKILQCSDREKLKDYLEKLLLGLSVRYTSPDSQTFPSNFELTRLTEVVTVLGRLVGVKKTDFGDLLSVMNRIENRWSKLELISFADKLLGQLCNVPVSPRAVIHKAIERCGKPQNAQREGLEQIDSFLDSKKWRVDFGAPWEQWYAAVKNLPFNNSFLKSENGKDLRDDFDKAISSHGRLLAFLFFMDLKRQQVEWNVKFAEQTRASLHWIYNLQRPNDFERLKQVYFGDTYSPNEMKEALARLDNRERRNRSYRKQQGKKKTVRTIAKRSRYSGK